jgi:small subunit ribosomal protein S8
MSMQDPIADMITRIKNATVMKKVTVSMPSSTMKQAIASVLKAEGYIQNFRVETEANTDVKKTLVITLKYFEGKSVIVDLTRISKLSRRVYSSVEDLPHVVNGLGIAIISTSKGVMSDALARKNQVGGEILCTVF